LDDIIRHAHVEAVHAFGAQYANLTPSAEGSGRLMKVSWSKGKRKSGLRGRDGRRGRAQLRHRAVHGERDALA
ncbi:hypothetical protein QM306_35160, partial [Burkholderia cenocepacia]|nr:hypothetical protein [Burkholderia cenocepacia]